MFTKKKLINGTCTGVFRKLIFTITLALFAVSISYAQKHSAGETHAYIAEISAINPQFTNSKVSGQAIFIIADGKLKITMVVKGLSPGMHLGHIHGFISDKASTCPPSNADTNGDGIIDLIETEPYAGTTLIPFNADPVGLQIKSDTYSVADKDGLLTYEITVPLNKLNAAIKKEYKIDNLSLDHRVIFIHGVPESMSLPKTVKSLPGVPAYITVPVACGEIKAL
ncbi:MAG: hypothetical protein ABI184_08125 [Ginsengibacter sp.]